MKFSTFVQATLFILVSAQNLTASVKHKHKEPRYANRALERAKNPQHSIFYHLGYRGQFGHESVSVEDEAFVRGIQKEMGMERYPIIIKKMSKDAILNFGYANAFVVPTFNPTVRTSYLYISQDWFNSLPTDAKTALIGHELAHIKMKHSLKLSTAAFSIFSASVVGTSIAMAHTVNAFPWLLDPINNLTLNLTAQLISLGFNIPATLTVLSLSRGNEQEADMISADYFGGEKVLLLMEELEKEYGKEENPSGFIKWAERTLGTHPRLPDRKKYMQEHIAAKNAEKAIPESDIIFKIQPAQQEEAAPA